MREISRRVITVILAVLALGGAQDDFKGLLKLVRIMDLNYWLTSGDWLPWGIRATVIALITLLALSPEWHIRMKNKLNPRWPDGTPQGIGFRFGFWRADRAQRRQDKKDAKAYDRFAQTEKARKYRKLPEADDDG